MAGRVPGPRARDRSGPSLGSLFDPRHNCVSLLRLVLATAVAVSHATMWGSGPPSRAADEISGLAVDAFFVLSGFLVTRSYLQLRSVRRFAWHRFLRIMPGFWVCLIVTAAVVAPLAGLLSGRSAHSVLSDPHDPAWRYVGANAALPMFQYGIAGLRTANGVTALDGSLWTLAYEAFCYALLALLGITALLARRWAVPVLAVAVWCGVLAQTAGLTVDLPGLRNDDMLRFLLAFILGVLGYRFADRVPIRWFWAAAAAALTLVAVLAMPGLVVLGEVPFAYLVLFAVVRLPVRREPSWDLSYGMYIYHWPVQFLLAMTTVTASGGPAFVLLTMLLTVPVAAMSWVLVERPALQRKNATWFGRRPSVAAVPRPRPSRRAEDPPPVWP